MLSAEFVDDGLIDGPLAEREVTFVKILDFPLLSVMFGLVFGELFSQLFENLVRLFLSQVDTTIQCTIDWWNRLQNL